MRLPPPDPHEILDEPPGLDLCAPTVIHLAGTPSPAAERLANALIELRPGALIVFSS